MAAPSYFNKTFEEKPPLFLIFADLDGTFTPIDLSGWQDFADVIQEIRAKEHVQVKFIPVSGRPSGYVLRILHGSRDVLDGIGMPGICDFGCAEQGALIVDSSRSYGPRFTGYPESTGLKAKIDEIIKKNEFAKIVVDEPDKIYTCSIHIKNEVKENMAQTEQQNVYNSIKKDIVAVYGEGVVDIAMSHNCMEVMTREISKANAMAMMIDRYRRDFNVVGLLYGGDAQNDTIAMQYVSRLAEIPGINAHNFSPANAQHVIDTYHIEPWKHKNPAASRHFVRKGTHRLFKGITELIRHAMAEDKFRGTGVEIWKTRDDSCPKHLKDLKLAKAKVASRKQKFSWMRTQSVVESHI